MALSSTVVCLLAGLLLLGLVRADVGVATQRNGALYPAAGFKPSRQFGLPATFQQPKSARLVANSEAQEDLDDAAEEVEVTQPKAVPVPRLNPAPGPALPVTPTIAYYPAGAVGFVQPATFAKLIGGPQQPAPYAHAPQFYQAYFG
ncbi:uncharacterized protein LOC6544172 [Drosophila erecta]|uniref:DUF4794 domain-containing protein n=1 Tax=Drosophila erecta TaxID=7220 RepID=B3NEG2_DROER|nr:uncharacterized protein LOC6544172 [Drosophila erecta]EDV52797.1 uncharacterized protein Dere_GG16280 [Drosophila erecta]